MKKRTIGLSIIIILLIILNVRGTFKVLNNSEKISEVYTSLSPELARQLAIINIAAIVSFFAIWYGKRWGIVLTIVVYIAVLFLDVYNQVWNHALVVTSVFALLMFFCWQSRKYFSSEN